MIEIVSKHLAAPNGGSALAYQELPAPLAIPATAGQASGKVVCLCIPRAWHGRPHLPLIAHHHAEIR
jgi:hypothetical protein